MSLSNTNYLPTTKIPVCAWTRGGPIFPSGSARALNYHTIRKTFFVLYGRYFTLDKISNVSNLKALCNFNFKMSQRGMTFEIFWNWEVVEKRYLKIMKDLKNSKVGVEKLSASVFRIIKPIPIQFENHVKVTIVKSRYPFSRVGVRNKNIPKTKNITICRGIV